MQKLAFTQKGVEGEQHRPWDVGGCALPGDFVLVAFGALAGKEGFVEGVTDSLDIVVDETGEDPSQPSLIVKGQHIDTDVKLVSKFLTII